MKLTFILFILAAIGAIFIFRQTQEPVPVEPTTQPTGVELPDTSPDFEVVIDERIYSVYWQAIEGNKISLIPNFEDRRTSTQLMEEYACDYGITGGFYSTDYKPIGLFVYDGITLSSAKFDETFNGFLVKESDGDLLITKSPPTENISFALQSGPYIGLQTTLRIREDDFERRMVVAKTDDDIWYFVAITEKENLYSGPKLAQVPDVLRKLPLSIDVALNLDGGSASAFHNTGGVDLGELTPIGSFFCGT